METPLKAVWVSALDLLAAGAAEVEADAEAGGGGDDWMTAMLGRRTSGRKSSGNYRTCISYT